MKIGKSLVLILFLLTGLALSAQCNVSAAEKQALIDLYNATDGPNWINSWDIINDEPCDWFGVTVSGSNVETLDLANNGLNGILPNIWPTLSQLTFLNMSGVQIVDFESNSAPYTLVFENVVFTGNIEFNSFSGTVSFQNIVEFAAGSQLLNNGFIDINNAFGFNGSLQNNSTGTIQGDFLVNASASIDNFGNIDSVINQGGSLFLNNQGNITSINNTGSMDVGIFGTINEFMSTSGNLNFIATDVVNAADSFEILNSTLNTLPDFDDETLTLFDITNSYLGFQSLESQFSALQQNASTFNYSPLRTTIAGDNELNSGQTLTLSVNVSGTSNHYTWFKDDVPIGSAPDSNTFSIPNVAVADAGSYRCEITNDIVTGGLIQSDLISVTVAPDPCGVSAAEKQALIDLYNATDGPNWTNTWDIVNDEPCDWYGIAVTNGEILNINLRNNNLTGTIPASIGDITSLEFLQLDNNNLSGSIPASIGNLVNLIQLRLHVNSFTGNIPSTLGNLGSLTLFLANDNSLSGEIPSTLGNLTNLNSLLLFNNNLSGSIPIEFGNLSSLGRLQLSQNQLSGNIPSAIASLGFLDFLQFANNQYVFSDFESEHTTYLNATTSYSFSPQAKVDQEETLSVLENGTITLTSTALTSPNNSYQWFKDGVAIPGATNKDYVITDATTDDAGVYYFEATNSVVTGLTLTRNDITLSVEADACGVSSDEKQALIDFYNSTNGDNWTTSWDIVNDEPCDWPGVTVVDGEVRELLLTANGLNGTLPASIGDLIHLTRFFLLSNINLTGTIPVEVGNMTSLEEFSIVLSNVSGGIPTSFSALTNLNTIRLEKNQLSGPLPVELTTLPSLSTLTLFENNFTGGIPIEYGNFPAIVNLRLDQNQLSGTVPTSLGNLTTVERLNLQVNQLSGNVPVELGNLPNLIELRLNGNNLSGDFPLLVNNPTLNYLNYQENLFVFSNLESNHPTYDSNINIYIFSPQARVDQEESLSVLENGTITLTSTALTSPNNSYQWFKDGVPIPGATSKDYVISDATTDDAGVYYFEATNSIVTGLTLTRNDITLTVDIDTCGVSAAERQALLDLYNSTDGDNWVNTLAGNQPWDSAIPVCDWFGVTVENGNVTNLNLNSNGLSGNLPPTLINLSSLTGLILFQNQLTGNIPLEYGSFSGLQVLNLSNNSLIGSIPSELGNLQSLTVIGISQNQLTGNIPTEIGGLVNLEFLTLNNNQLSGLMPSELGALTNLKQLNLFNNQLIGGIPVEFQNLVSLQQLAIQNNQLSGNIPVELENLSNLTDLTINNNQLVGEIPSSLGNLSVLRKLYLHNNLLSGGIPLELGNLPALRFLNLSNNQLVGNIPTELLNNSNLNEIQVHTNNLSGAIPDFSGFNLTFLQFFSNNFVFSDFESEHSSYQSSVSIIYRYIPQAKVDQEESLSVLENGTITLTSTALASSNNSYQWFKDGVAIPGATNKDYVISDATTDDAGVYYFEATNSIVTGLTLTRNDITLTVDEDSCGVSAAERQALLDLYNSTNGDNWVNTLAGNQPWDPAIPVCDWFGVTVVNGNVTSVDLDRNDLTGTLPNSIGDLIHVTYLELAHNQIAGTLPPSIGSMTSLNTLLLELNQFSGDIPSTIGNLSNLVQLKANNNSFTGSIPTEIGNLSNLNRLNLNQNDLSGSLPTELGNLSNLNFLYLTDNELSGSIPSELGNLTNLRYFWLSNNQLTGPIPPELGNMTSAIDFHVDGNSLTGTIPAELGNLVNLDRIRLERNQLTGAIPSEFGNFSVIRTIFLHDNLLSGSIPSELGQLSNLVTLYLHQNQLTGTIPSELGQLNDLRNLLLSQNLLIGSIPVELGQLPALQSISLNENQLSGNIPSQFSTLSTLNSFNFVNNNFVFSNFEAEHPTYVSNLGTYNYFPQAKVDQEETLSVLENGAITLTSTALTSPNNSYQWFKDGVPIPGATGKDYVISDASSDDAGVYYFEATNSIVTGLTLTRNDITLTVDADACGVSAAERQALLDLYNSTNGDNWTNTLAANQPWDPAIPVCDWFGVVVVNNQVTELNLNDNGLNGTIPSTISILSGLRILNLYTNSLVGAIPDNIELLTELRFLRLFENQLTGSIPSGIGQLTNLSRLRLEVNQLDGNIPIGLGQLSALTDLRFGRNNLSGPIPDVTSFPLQTLDFDSNNFIFEDFESEHLTYVAGINAYDFSPQAKVDEEESLSVLENGTITLTSTTLTSPNNSYQWYKDGVAIPGATGKDYVISDASSDDAGVYYFEATNSIVTGLTLTRNDIALTVDPSSGCLVSEADKQILLDFYNNTNGDNWVNTLAGDQPWDAATPVCDWFGLNVNQDGSIEAITLSGNGLNGTLSSGFGSLSYLGILFLGNNQLQGTIPLEIAQIPGLREFRVSNNNLAGSLPSFSNDLSSLFFAENNFIFEDFESDHPRYEANLIPLLYQYSPQAKVDQEQTLSVDENGTITLTSDVLTSPNNSYQWYKDGVAISGATGKDYVITNATTDDEGVYYFEATNSIIGGLTLTRNDITLTIDSGPQIGVQEFCTMNGQPTVTDLFFPAPDDLPVTWFAEETGGNPLSETTILVNEAIYYADFPGNGGDRIPYQVLIDNNIPTGDTEQSFDFATNPTLADVVVQGAGGTSVIWFDSVDGTTPLPFTTTLVDGETYFAQSDLTDALCRLGISVSDNGPTEICEEVLVQSGSGGGSVIDGSFELASNVIIPNNRNEAMGNSGWGATQGTPDTFATPYNNSNDPELLDSFISSPNGGICAGAQRIANQAEAFAANISGLSTSTTYVVEFYQANVSNVLSDEISRDANGFWEVRFGGVSKTSSPIGPSISGNTNWRKQSLEFNVSSTTQLLEFSVASSAQNQNNAYPVYMLIDGIRVYEKPVDIYTTVCYDLFTQVFCNYDDDNEPTIGDLEAPNGSAVTWYSNRTGGERYFSNELLVDLPSFIVWADDGVNDRVAVEILFDFGSPLGDTYQFFDLNGSPTLADIVIEGTNITWHSSFESETVLPLSTPLTDNTIYYAAQDGNECRLSVLIELGIPNPLGNQYQEFCSTTNPTIADLVVETTSPGYTILWYSAETGGTIYNSTDALEDGQTYYAEQTDGANTSEGRIPFVVSVIDITASVQIQDLDIEVPNNSTVQDLTDFFSLSPGIVWYNDPYEGTAYSVGAQLFDGETYYGRLNTGGICEASEVLAVTVSIADVVEPELITCIKFIPQPGRHYVIGAWAREQPVQAEPAGTSSFEEVKDSFLELLDYLTTKILSREEIPSVLVLKEDADAPDVDDLLPYVKNTEDKNLKVYDFAFEKETVGGVEKSVGFSFSLAPGNTERFVYLTPTAALTFDIFGVSLGDFSLGYRFPIRNYEGLEIEFTDVAVVAGKFRITSNFTVVDDSSPYLKKEYTNETVDSTTDSGIEDVIQLFNFVEIPGTQPSSYDLTSLELSYKDASGTDLPDLDGISEVVFEPKGAVIDGWQRIAGDFTIPSDAAYMKITLRNRGANLNAYFDDVRIVPFDGNMKSFVYDPITQRLMAELDENNYATFYEYDTEGGLVRVKKETERGIYTIQETRSGNSKLNVGE